MNRKALERWAATVDWSATYTCSRCHRTGPGHEVQPQPHGGPLCVGCINEINRQIRAERRRQLAAMPRCEVPGCSRRATVWHPRREGGTGLCGRHWKRAERAIYASMGAFPLFGVVILDREALIRAALEGS